MDAQSFTEPLERIDMANELQVGFNPAAHPIIARHFFGVEPFRPIDSAGDDVIGDLRFQRQIQHLFHLGPRAVGEFLAEIAAERSIRAVVDIKLVQYGKLSREQVEIAGGCNFWPAPLRAVGGQQ